MTRAGVALALGLSLGFVGAGAACPKGTGEVAAPDAGASEDDRARERILADALRGLQCPDGTRRVGDEPPVGREVWCERAEAVRHGPYRAWHEGGAKAVVGQYVEGQRDGAWAEWFANGQRKSEMVYAAGTPDGPFMEWDESGDVVGRGAYELGVLKAKR